MNLRDLEYFEAVARNTSLVRAAEVVGRTQSALTKCIQRLEDEVGAPLLVRDGRSIKLTPVGEILVDRGRRTRALIDEQMRELSDFACGKAGRVRVGTGATTAEFLLPSACAQLLGNPKGAEIEVIVGLNDALRSMLRENRIDVAIGPLMPADHREFAVHKLGMDQVVPAARSSHPAFETNPCMESLTGYQWLAPGGSVALRNWLDATYDAKGMKRPSVVLETNVLPLMFSIIANTDLIIFTSRYNLLKIGATYGIRHIEVPELTMQREIGLIYYEGQTVKPITRQFIASVVQSTSFLTE